MPQTILISAPNASNLLIRKMSKGRKQRTPTLFAILADFPVRPFIILIYKDVGKGPLTAWDTAHTLNEAIDKAKHLLLNKHGKESFVFRLSLDAICLSRNNDAVVFKLKRPPEVHK